MNEVQLDDDHIRFIYWMFNHIMDEFQNTSTAWQLHNYNEVETVRYNMRSLIERLPDAEGAVYDEQIKRT
jgi:hypothetical protein